MNPTRAIIIVIAATILALAFIFVNQSDWPEEAAEVRLEENLITLPLGLQKENSPEVLRVAIGSMISPAETYKYYYDMLGYLEGKLGKKVALSQRRSYEEVNELIFGGKVDLAFICSGPYVKAEWLVDLLVAPQVDGKTEYHALLIVPTDSDAEELADLKGKRFAFMDPDSHTGKVYPTWRLMQMGESPESFFGEYIYTHSHDNSIRAVAKGIVDGASVHSLVYDYVKTRRPDLTDKTRVIERSKPFGIPPVVVRQGLDEEEVTVLRDIFLNMDKDPLGKQILTQLNIDRFVTISSHAYDSVRRMVRGEI